MVKQKIKLIRDLCDSAKPIVAHKTDQRIIDDVKGVREIASNSNNDFIDTVKLASSSIESEDIDTEKVKIITHFQEAFPWDYGDGFNAIVTASIQSEEHQWSGDLFVQLYDGEFSSDCQVSAIDLYHQNCLMSDYDNLTEFSSYTEEAMTEFFDKVIEAAERGFSEEYTFEALLEERTGLDVEDYDFHVVGCGVGNDIHLKNYKAVNGEQIVLVAVDNRARAELRINRFKIFASNDDYNEFLDECRNLNGQRLQWNDWNYALNIYQHMDKPNNDW
ncbi:hypothetical protein [Vibrio cholerae]|uniref:hypothetical protein n=1 Tax=Vibrio cholerae TaxID=666 RepID=UPI0011D86436|nr:hypothetical protein [Vibrio cholerae]EGQ9434250.1 hypothetical protein [Vibrio cholerae]EGR2040937.1 hypothetical protein [Vibrio cholerae]EGR2064730.1 hypothetical protein [Vibrio cholerae]EGR2115801.1 hypothetical protein [Vibrio cholerae]EGR2244553.1 hypothetical protein [Vibrio cholerae]